jgi:hypothetical protein
MSAQANPGPIQRLSLWCGLHICTIDIDPYLYRAHPFQKKEWYNVHVPTVFDVRNPTITPCNRTAGQSKYRRSRCPNSLRRLILKLPNFVVII